MDKRIIIIEDNIKIGEGFASVMEHTSGYFLAGQYGTYEDALKRFAFDRGPRTNGHLCASLRLYRQEFRH